MLVEERIRDCAHLLRTAPADIWSTKGPEPFSTVGAWRVTCAAIQRMVRAKPARVSYVAFNVEEVIPGLAKLEVQLGDPSDRGYFLPLSGVRELRCFKPTRCLVTTERDRFAIELLAVGDFDGDGAEDVLGQASAGPVDGTMTSTRGFLLTKVRVTGELTLLEWW